MNFFNKSIALLATVIFSLNVQASDWVVDNEQSQLSFVSVKKVNIAEVHHFSQLSGGLTEGGEFIMDIELASVNTGIEIRDSRMKEFLFKVTDFPEARLSAQLDTELFESLAVGESAPATVEGNLSLHGQQQMLSFDVLVTKVSAEKLLVVSAQPAILNVADYELTQGVEKLRELAGLPSISQAVPVSFYLTLNAAN
jgi:polyisoprenoid-binding protein YceI